MNRRDQPYGASPHGDNYGTIPWDDAMRLPGSQQLALGKALLERYSLAPLRASPGVGRLCGAAGGR